MTPKVDANLRTTGCNLGLWTSADEVTEYKTKFALGQNFIRKYGVVYKFVERTAGNEISMTIYLGNATPRASMVFDYVICGLTTLGILAFLGCFTVMKFRRVRTEK